MRSLSLVEYIYAENIKFLKVALPTMKIRNGVTAALLDDNLVMLEVIHYGEDELYGEAENVGMLKMKERGGPH